MSKKILVFILTALFMTQSFAATNAPLKEVFDDLNYSLNVEWDQKDRNFYNQKMDSFIKQIKGLRDQGLTNQELIDYTVSQIKDKKLADDVRTGLSMVSINSMNSEEAHEYVSRLMTETYSSGASWSGQGVVAGAVLAVVFIAVASVLTYQYGICARVYSCERDCFFGVCNEECRTRCI